MTNATTVLGDNGGQDPAAAAPQQPPAPGIGHNGGPDWLGELKTDADTVKFVQGKGWADKPWEAVRSFRNLESALGNRVPLPRDENDVEGLNRIYDRLGRPETPEKYDFGLPEGAAIDEEFLGHMRPLFHKSGVTARQAKELAAGYQAYAEQAQQKIEEEAAAKSAAEFEALKKTWGPQFDDRVAAGRKFAKAFNVTADQVQAIEAAIGTGATLDLFARIGLGLGEAAVPSDASSAGNLAALSSASAEAAIKARIVDKDFQQRLARGEVAALKEWQQLHEAATR